MDAQRPAKQRDRGNPAALARWALTEGLHGASGRRWRRPHHPSTSGGPARQQETADRQTMARLDGSYGGESDAACLDHRCDTASHPSSGTRDERRRVVSSARRHIDPGVRRAQVYAGDRCARPRCPGARSALTPRSRCRRTTARGSKPFPGVGIANELCLVFAKARAL